MISQKITTSQEAADRIAEWKNEGDRVVFTNGCFDIIHPGHVLYLESAKAQGNRLVVGLNADTSVRRLKGAERPIQAERARATVLAALASVDLVVVFEEDTPQRLIEAICPDILVKGGDWSVDEIVGADFVLGQGGEVKSLQFEDGFSSTNIIDKIKNL